MDWRSFGDFVNCQALGVTITMLTLGVTLIAMACAGPENQQLSAPTPVMTTDVVQSPQTLTAGRVVRVLDGVTIEVESGGRTYVVRYLGVSLPNGGDVRTAFEFNAFLVEGKTVELSTDTVDVDLDGALLRYVFADGEMVNLKLLIGGWGEVAQFPASFEKFEEFFKAESEARSDGRGIWSVEASFSSEDRTPTTQPTSNPNFAGGTLPARSGSPTGPASVCDFSGANTPVIKGNVEQRTGERLYHVPDGLFYSTTVIEPDQGDRWFCTEAEAQALGWKRSTR